MLLVWCRMQVELLAWCLLLVATPVFSMPAQDSSSEEEGESVHSVNNKCLCTVESSVTFVSVKPSVWTVSENSSVLVVSVESSVIIVSLVSSFILV